jgi:DNA-binding SARP family transcriptional activator
MQQSEQPTIRLIALGGLMVERPGAVAEAPPLQQRQALLLVLLASLGRDGGVTRDRLIGFFWPDRPAERARNLLDQALSWCRRAPPCRSIRP